MLAERHKSKDTLGVYEATDQYKLVRVCCLSSLLSNITLTSRQHFPLPTSSLASISLSPTGNHIAVWEGPLEVSSILALKLEEILTLIPSLSCMC